MLSSTATELQNQYDTGQRDFQKAQLRRVNLNGLNLSHANLKGADLSYANLRNVNFSGADLSDAYLDEADLTGANLQGANLSNASLLKTYLIKTNLENANLQNAYLTGSYLTKVNLQGALLQGTYLNGTQLSGANFKGAKYNEATKFDHSVNLSKLGLEQASEIDRVSNISSNSPTQLSENLATSTENSGDLQLSVTPEAIVRMLNHLTETSYHYLGNVMTVRYYKSSRPKEDWLKEFEIDNSAKITYIGSQKKPLSSEQLETVREWVIAFVKSCSMIIQNYTQMLNPEFLVFPIVSQNINKKNPSKQSVNQSTVKSTNPSNLVTV